MRASQMTLLVTGKALGQVGYSNGFGRIRLGYTRFGLLTDWYAIFRRTKRLTGRVINAVPFYRPTNPQTTLQQSWRGVFSDGAIHWQSLSSGEKAEYNKNAKRRRMTGFNLHQSEYLARNRI